MKVFTDTSILVAAFYAAHPRHEDCLALLGDESDRQLVCGAQTLAEFYATVTAMPMGGRRVTGEVARLFLEDVRARFAVVTLNEGEYWDVVAGVAKLGLASGAIYDALLARCAANAGAEAIYTLNRKHFARLEDWMGIAVREPGK